jgi:alkanesulfonate monooxygenase SsuD/methylene tetrahydromethanopterin reductase-like flavin-dependent oxidoreductase (luciferase family)
MKTDDKKAGIAAVTSKIKLFASTAVLTLPPALCARMATTIDSIAPGRFGINIVTGWQAAECKLYWIDRLPHAPQTNVPS